MLEARVSPNARYSSGRYSPPRSRCRRAGVVLVVVLSLSFGVLVAGAGATVPGHPGVPQSPTIVYPEDFENGLGQDAGSLTKYSGAPPLLEKYTAAAPFLKNCNGDIVEFESNERESHRL